MTGVFSQPSQTEATATIELKGHLIDSLTLSKVIDRIQALGGDYRLNDIQIGSLKKDISSVNLTLLATDAQKLAELKEELSHYGAVVTSEINAEFVQCTKNGEVPEEAFILKAPKRVFYEGRWFSLNWEDVVVVFDPAQEKARLEQVGQVKAGTSVVVGTQGLEW
jgi:hypothetical protein